LNKAELVGAVSTELGSKAAAGRAVNAVLKAIRQGLKKDKRVNLSGFGTFVVRMRKARIGRNPKTGETIKVRRSKSVGFKAGGVLRKAL